MKTAKWLSSSFFYSDLLAYFCRVSICTRGVGAVSKIDFSFVGIVASVIALVVLAGCATTPLSNAAASVAPSSRVLAPDLQVQREGTIKLTIKRDGGFMGAACAHKVFIDGRPVAQLRSGEMVQFFVKPGRYMLGATAEGICGGGTAEAQAIVDGGRVSNYRISAGQDGTLALSPTAF